MIIDENLLLKYGADYENYSSNDVIFHEGSSPQFYYQIVQGTVELSSYHESGKECIHNILSDGQCLGESLLFIDKAYLMNATAKSECTLIKLSKTRFLDLLAHHPEATVDMFTCLSDRLYHKYLLLFNMSSPDSCFRIKAIMDYYKEYNYKTAP